MTMLRYTALAVGLIFSNLSHATDRLSDSSQIGYSDLEKKSLSILREIESDYKLDGEDFETLKRDFKETTSIHDVLGEIDETATAYKKEIKELCRQKMCTLATNLYSGFYGSPTQDQLGIAVSLYVRAALLDYAPAIYKLGKLGEKAGFLLDSSKCNTLIEYSKKIHDSSAQELLLGLYDESEN